MGTDTDPGIDRILLHSDDPSLRILGYGMAEGSFHYDELVDGARLNGESAVDDSLTVLQRRGHVRKNGDGGYHLPRDRFNGPRARHDALELVRDRIDDGAVYRHVADALDGAGAAAVPAAYLDDAFPDRDWRVELSPFVMAHALRRPNYYSAAELPELVPDGAADHVDGDYPVEVYEFGDPIYRRAAEEVITETAPAEALAEPLTTG
ncbi:MAG: hypothetical protein ABEI97_04985 [Candidatus Nanohaloarchaea archaeon]